MHASQKKGGGAFLIFDFFLIIYIIIPLYRRKFCDGHIILGFFIIIIHMLQYKFTQYKITSKLRLAPPVAEW